MGTGRQFSFHETDATRAKGRDAEFEAVIERIKASGGKMISDEITPLYTEIGSQQFEVGSQRTVEFNLNRFDFKLIRNTETHLLQGSGKQKHIEPFEIPRVKMTLKRKAETSEDWQVIDFEDMF